MVNPKYVFVEDAAEDALARESETGRPHFIHAEEPRMTGPAGACYYVSADEDATEHGIDPHEVMSID